jgi:hypothetical protein
MNRQKYQEIFSNIFNEISLINFDDLAAIGTFVSSIIALIALRELVKQRRAMYQPSLFLNEFTLSVKGNPLTGVKKFYYYKLYNLYEPENRAEKTPHSIQSQFFLQNFGYGIANNIKYKWEFDSKKAVKKICDLTPEMRYQQRNNSIIILKKDEFFDSVKIDEFSNEKKIDFIQPETIKTNNKPLSIPSVVTSLHMHYVLIKNKMENEICNRFTHESFEDFPKPKLTVIYEDIAKKKYTNTYIFEIDCGNTFFQSINDKTIDTKDDFANLSFNIK